MAFKIQHIKINQMEEPLGIDIKNPVFSWQISTDKESVVQMKQQILVGTKIGAKDCWDSGIVLNDISTGTLYEGIPLKRETRYYVTIYIWDQKGNRQEASTWFETGLMDDREKAWEGAQWIGAPEYYVASDTLSVFTIESRIKILEGNRAGIVFGANDARLMDIEKNELGVAGENYISYVLNIETEPATIEIYRVGYSKDDKKDQPFAVILAEDVKTKQPVITNNNKYEEHKLTIQVVGNCAYTFLDDIKIDEEERMSFMGPEIGGRQLNPLGVNDTTTYPRLCEIGYYIGEKTKAYFDGIHVFNLREPKAEIVSLDTKEGKLLEGETMELKNPSKGAIPMFRHKFFIQKKVKAARLYATARGIYECSINGKQIGNEYFAPGCSQFDKHLMYQTYDVTDALCQGENAIGCILASGWWSDASTFTLTNYNYWGDKMSFLGRLVIYYEDGSCEKILTNTRDWKYFGEGPYRYAGFFHGEQYDARKKNIYTLYSTPDFEDKDWKKPSVIEPIAIIPKQGTFPAWPAVNLTAPKLVGHYQAPVKEVEVLDAKKLLVPADHVYIYDLGQEIAGVPRIYIKGREGQKITIRYGEMLYPELPEYENLAGRMLQVNLREASNVDTYICSGEEKEIYQPKFTYHSFRYIEITGIDQPLGLDDVKGVLLSSVHKISGEFECSNPLVNQFFSNVGYSQKCNFISIPTDCPQRNERMGWVGDTHVFCHTALLQSDAKNFYLRNLQAMRDLQEENGRLPNIAPIGGGFGGITYESAMILITWELYQHYGDFSIVEEYYDSMNLWMKSMESLGMPGTPREFGLGDWLALQETDNYLIWNAFYYRDAKIMHIYAQKLGRKEDADQYQNIAENTKKYWNKYFVDPKNGCTRSVDGSVCDTQGSYAIALSCDIYDEIWKKKAWEHLARKVSEADFTVQTGFFGTGVLNPVLSAGGYEEFAQKMITQTMFPSWLYPVTQGATTIWEHWDSYTKEKGFGDNNAMNSFNHYSLGSVVSWLYENVIGIKRDKENPGYKHFILKPEMGTFTYAKGGIESPYGKIESAWEMDDKQGYYRCKIPGNTTATLIIGNESIELNNGVYEFRYTGSTWKRKEE